MKRFILYILFAIAAYAMEIRGVKSLYAPTESLQPQISHIGSKSYDIYAKLKIPNGKLFYLTPDGLSKEKIKYAHIEDSTTYHLFHDNKFIYEKNGWLPQGEYTLEVSVESNRTIVESKDINFSFLSHQINFPKYLSEKRVYNFRVLPSVKNSAWIVFEQRDDSVDTKEKGRIFTIKINKDANILIPPFEIARVAGDPNYSNRWCVAKERDGGFFIFYDRYYENKYYYQDLIGAYFDKNGKKVIQKTVWHGNHIDIADYPIEFPKEAFVDRDKNLSILITRAKLPSGNYRNDLLILNQKIKIVPITNEDENGNFQAYYDKKEAKLYIITNNHHSSNQFYFCRYGIDGTLEVKKDITNTFSNDLNIYFNQDFQKQKELFKTDRGILFLYPKPNEKYIYYILFDKDGNIIENKKITTPGIAVDNMKAYYDIIRHNGSYWMLARNSSSTMTLLSFDDNQTKFYSGAMKAKYFYNPSLIELNGKLFLSSRATSEPYFFRGWFLRNDKPLGESDLAISKLNIMQKPYYATLDKDTQLSFKIFNVGEANSTASSLHIDYMGDNYSQSIPIIEPGEKYELNISIAQPPYLTQMPVITTSLTNDFFTQNNFLTDKIRYIQDTPVYPPKAKMYNWRVVDSIDKTAIPYVRIKYLYKNLQTVSGEKKDIRFVQNSDEDGEFSTILEDGNYTFYLSKFGGNYPKTIITKNIPANNDTFTLRAAGNLHLDFQQDNADALHPIPQNIHITMQHRYAADMPDWKSYIYDFKGNENGAEIKRVMPGEYNLTIKTFGYEKKTVSGVEVASKKEKNYTISLTALPRGNICGKVVDADKNSVEDAFVSLVNLPYYVMSDDNGNFCLQDLEKGRAYKLKLSKTDYLPFFYTFTLNENNLSVGNLTLPKINYKTVDLSQCRYAAWSQDVKWEDTENSYEIKDLYGVWDMSGYIYYSQSQNQTKAHILMLSIDTKGLLWAYYGLDGHVVKAMINWGADVVSDVAEGAAEALGGTLKFVSTYILRIKKLKDFADDLLDWANMPQNFISEYKNLSNPFGTVKGGVVDCGSLDALSRLTMPTASTPKADKTVLRFDDIQILNNDSVIYSSHQESWRQYYTDTMENLTIPLNLDVDSIDNVRVKLYVAVMNGNYDSGPLALPGSDHLMLQYKVAHGKLHLEKIESSPIDYPSFEY